MELGHPHASSAIADEGQDERNLVAPTDAEGNVDGAVFLSTNIGEPPLQSSLSTSAVVSGSAAMAGTQSTKDPTCHGK